MRTGLPCRKWCPSEKRWLSTAASDRAGGLLPWYRRLGGLGHLLTGGGTFAGINQRQGPERRPGSAVEFEGNAKEGEVMAAVPGQLLQVEVLQDVNALLS